MRKISMFNIKFDNYSFHDLFEFIDETIKKNEQKYILTCNVDHIIKIQKDKEFNNVYKNAHAVVADGMPVIWASKILKKPLKEKVSGSDIFDVLGNRFEKKGHKLFFLGAAEGVAEKAKKNLINRYPNINIVGTYSPSYGFENDEEENRKILKLLSEIKPDILLVGVGAPKQEKWIYKYYKEYKIPISIGVGATFDFLAENVTRAPRILQKIGLEWCWRLLQEPSRLWKRYLVEDTKFLSLLFKEIIKKN
jgi:N-acetylglucosaminyldiphosphoundecaprenol N-acetyl-beta-D-mannosaminyltransferase